MDVGCEIACGTITDADNRNLCLAAVKDDVGYCEKIQNQETYEKCLEAFGKSPDAEFIGQSFTCNSDCPAPPEGLLLGSCDIFNEDSYSVLRCVYSKTQTCEHFAGLEKKVSPDCVSAGIKLCIYQCDTEKVAEGIFHQLTKGMAGSSTKWVGNGITTPLNKILYTHWSHEFILDENCVIDIEANAIGEMEAKLLLEDIKPRAESFIKKLK